MLAEPREPFHPNIIAPALRRGTLLAVPIVLVITAPVFYLVFATLFPGTFGLEFGSVVWVGTTTMVTLMVWHIGSLWIAASPVRLRVERDSFTGVFLGRSAPVIVPFDQVTEVLRARMIRGTHYLVRAKVRMTEGQLPCTTYLTIENGERLEVALGRWKDRGGHANHG